MLHEPYPYFFNVPGECLYTAWKAYCLKNIASAVDGYVVQKSLIKM